MVDIAEQQPERQVEGRESSAWIVTLLGSLLLLTVAGVLINWGREAEAFKQWNTFLGILVTLGIFTIIYRENPLFRFLEHIFIGLAAGFGVVLIWVRYIESHWFVPLMPSSLLPANAFHGEGQGQWWMIFALLIGLLFFTVYIPKLSWMNRFAYGILMGWAAGAAFQIFVGLLAPQLIAAFRAPVTTYNPPQETSALNNIHVTIFGTDLWLHPFTLISLIILVCVLSYFFFSVEHRQRWIRQPALAGRYLLMITLGAIFGTTVMGRFALLIGRFEYLIDGSKQLFAWFQGLFG